MRSASFHFYHVLAIFILTSCSLPVSTLNGMPPSESPEPRIPSAIAMPSQSLTQVITAAATTSNSELATPVPAESQPPAPTETPVAAPPSSEVSARSAAGLGGCPVFPVSNIWNVPVDTLPVDPNSESYVDTLGRDTNLHPDFGAGLWEGQPIGIPTNLISGGLPPSAIDFYYPDESDPGPYPIPPNALIEGGVDSDGDRHILIVDQDTCLLYEIYDAWPQADGSWQAGSGALFDLNSNTLRPSSWTSADAAGLPILPGLVRYEEVAAGVIPHAIRFTASDIRHTFVWPARHRATCGGRGEDDMSVPPMGQRFRLKADYDISSYPSEAQVILTALKRYGMMLADCGSNWFITGSPDPRWDDEAINTLKSVPGSAFEAVDVSGLMINPDSAEAHLP